MVEQATFMSLKVEFENMVMSMLIINPGLQFRIIEWGRHILKSRGLISLSQNPHDYPPEVPVKKLE